MVFACFALVACSRAAAERPFGDVRRDDLVIGVEVTGVLKAVDSTQITPPGLRDVWDYKIASLAPEGADVKAGDPIVSFDPSELVRLLETMTGEADAAQKKLDKKRNEAALARRDDELKVAQAEAAQRKAKLEAEAADSAVTGAVQLKLDQLDAERAELDLQAAKNHAGQARRSDDDEIKRLGDAAAYAKSRVAAIAESVARMQVKSPRDGTVVYPSEEGREKHKVGDSVWRLDDVVDVVGLGKMTGSGQIDEVDMARVAEHQAVSVRLDALPDVQLRGRIASIAKSVTSKSGQDPSKTVKLTIELDATVVPLRPGMRFRGQIEIETLRQIVVAPSDAVFATPDGPVAYRERDGKLERVRVVLGKRNATSIEIVSGLAAGDRVSRIDPEAP
jgi:hypothetical protein